MTKQGITKYSRGRNKEATDRLKVLIMLSGLILCVSRASAQGTHRTIKFEDQPTVPPGTGLVVTSYFEGEIAFTPLGAGGTFGRAGGGNAGFPENGSAYLIFGFGDSLAGARSPSGHFGLVSVDVSEFSILYSFPKTITFIGYRGDGNTVKTDFTTDGIIDGTGTLADFQTFYFDERFKDLVKFEVGDYGYALDNLVLFDVIPEPGIGGLVVLGAALLCLRRGSERARGRG